MQVSKPLSIGPFPISRSASKATRLRFQIGLFYLTNQSSIRIAMKSTPFRSVRGRKRRIMVNNFSAAVRSPLPLDDAKSLTWNRVATRLSYLKTALFGQDTTASTSVLCILLQSLQKHSLHCGRTPRCYCNIFAKNHMYPCRAYHTLLLLDGYTIPFELR